MSPSKSASGPAIGAQSLDYPAVEHEFDVAQRHDGANGSVNTHAMLPALDFRSLTGVDAVDFESQQRSIGDEAMPLLAELP